MFTSDSMEQDSGIQSFSVTGYSSHSLKHLYSEYFLQRFFFHFFCFFFFWNARKKLWFFLCSFLVITFAIDYKLWSFAISLFSVSSFKLLSSSMYVSHLEEKYMLKKWYRRWKNKEIFPTPSSKAWSHDKRNQIGKEKKTKNQFLFIFCISGTLLCYLRFLGD